MGKFPEELKKEMGRRLARSGLAVQREAQKRIHGERATNPPHLLGIITGRLRGSIAVDLASDGLSVTVGTNVEYAEKHELGIFVPARPFMGPGLKAAEPFILKEVGDGIDVVLRGI